MSQNSTLQRGLNTRHIRFLALGSAIGTGLFYGSATAIKMAGPSVLLAYIVAGIAIYIVMRALGEMAVHNPVSGSFSHYASQYIGPLAGFTTGWTYVFEMVIVAIADVTAFGIYMGFWYPDVPRWIWILSLIMFLGAINLIHVKVFGELEFWLSIVKVSAIVAMILGGIGLNLDHYRYSENFNSNISFIFIARLLAEKGIHDYIKAAKIVKLRYPQVNFTVLGAIDREALGSLKEEELENLVRTSIIEYPGYVSNVSEWIEKSSVFVLPSYREGVPRSTQEAMAIGRAVITTDVPGCRETVVDGVNGFLVPKWDPEALAKKMIYFIEHPEQARLMGAESYKIAVEKFDAEKVNQRLVNILGL